MQQWCCIDQQELGEQLDVYYLPLKTATYDSSGPTVPVLLLVHGPIGTSEPQGETLPKLS